MAAASATEHDEVAPRFVASLNSERERVDITTCIQLNELQQDLIRELLNVVDEETTVTERRKQLCVNEIRRHQDGHRVARPAKMLLSSFAPYFSSRSFEQYRTRATVVISEPKRYVHDAQLNIDGEYETALETYQSSVTTSAWSAADKVELVRGVLRDIRSQLERPLLRQLNNAVERLSSQRHEHVGGMTPDGMSDSPRTQVVSKVELETRIATLRMRLDELRRLSDAAVYEQACEEMGGAEMVDERVDWLRVACVILHGRFSDVDCLLKWTNDASVRLRSTTPWTSEEDALLAQLAATHSNTNWVAVAHELNTGRSAFHCLRRVQQMHNAQSAPWSVTEDERLMDAVELTLAERGMCLSSALVATGVNGELPRAFWRLVCAHLEDRSAVECGSRLRTLLREATSDERVKASFFGSAESQRRAALLSRVAQLAPPCNTSNAAREKQLPRFWRRLRKWTVAEDARLTAAVDQLGANCNWERVAMRLAGRDAAQCRERFALLASARQPRWTYEDDRRLLLLLTAAADDLEAVDTKQSSATCRKRHWYEMADELKRNVNAVVKRAEALRALLEKANNFERERADSNSDPVDLHALIRRPPGTGFRRWRLDWTLAYRCWKQYVRDPVTFAGYPVPHPLVGEAIRTLRCKQLRSEKEIKRLVDFACTARYFRFGKTRVEDGTANESLAKRLKLRVSDEDFATMRADTEAHGDFLQRPAMYAFESCQARRFLLLVHNSQKLHDRVAHKMASPSDFGVRLQTQTGEPLRPSAVSVREMLKLSRKYTNIRRRPWLTRRRHHGVCASLSPSGQRERATNNGGHREDDEDIPNVPQVRALTLAKTKKARSRRLPLEQRAHIAPVPVQINERAFLRAAFNMSAPRSNANVSWDSAFVMDHTVLLPPNRPCLSVFYRMQYLLSRTENRLRPHCRGPYKRKRDENAALLDSSKQSIGLTNAYRTQAFKRLLERCMLLFGWSAALSEIGENVGNILSRADSTLEGLPMEPANQVMQAATEPPGRSQQTEINCPLQLDTSAMRTEDSVPLQWTASNITNWPVASQTPLNEEPSRADLNPIAHVDDAAPVPVPAKLPATVRRRWNKFDADELSADERTTAGNQVLLKQEYDDVNDPEWLDDEDDEPIRKRRRKQQRRSTKTPNIDDSEIALAQNSVSVLGVAIHSNELTGDAACSIANGNELDSEKFTAGVVHLDNGLELRYDSHSLFRILSAAIGITPDKLSVPSS